MQLLCFRIERHRYALDLATVDRVLRAVAIDTVPGLPPMVHGVFSLHGRLVPVADMRRRLGLAGRDIELDDRIVVTRAGERLLGIVVEGGTEVVDCAADRVVDAESLAPERGLAAGIACLGDDLVLIQDLSAFLSAEAGEALDKVLDGSH